MAGLIIHHLSLLISHMTTLGWHCLLLATVLTSAAAPSNDSVPLAPPRDLRVLSRQLRVDLAWGAIETPVKFEVQRSRNPKGPFETLPVEFPSLAIYTDLVGQSRG